MKHEEVIVVGGGPCGLAAAIALQEIGLSPLVIEKGSISLDGISLTIFDVTKTEFSVAIIPYTFAHTNIKNLEEGAKVNLEFDMIGKYVHRHLELTTR